MKKDYILKAKLRILRDQLIGHYPKVAQDCDTTTATVCRVLNGKQNNDEVLISAIKIRDEILILNKAKQSKKEQILDSI